jgi:nitrilase
MRVALFQGPASSGDVKSNVGGIARAAETAAARGADLLVTPEMSTTGYNIGPLSGERAEPSDGPISAAIAVLARHAGLAILYGYPERADDVVFNAVNVVGPDGSTLAHYRKTHLYGDLDKGLFAPGHDLVAQFPLAGLTCGLGICYDMEFPELARAHADAGTDVLLAPTGLMSPFEVVSRILVPARAYENQMFVVYVNRCDVEGELHYCGLSCAIGPDGADLARAGAGEELLIADLDPDLLARSRVVNTHLSDRRSDLYSTSDRREL